jgi:hypothetical protein
MSYGLKCFNASGYITFDTETMSSYLKVTATGSVTIQGNSLSSTITAEGVDYIYVWSGPSPTSVGNTIAERYEIASKLTNSFRIRNLTSTQQTFDYIAFTR